MSTEPENCDGLKAARLAGLINSISAHYKTDLSFPSFDLTASEQKRFDFNFQIMTANAIALMHLLAPNAFNQRELQMARNFTLIGSSFNHYSDTFTARDYTCRPDDCKRLLEIVYLKFKISATPDDVIESRFFSGAFEAFQLERLEEEFAVHFRETQNDFEPTVCATASLIGSLQSILHRLTFVPRELLSEPQLAKHRISIQLKFTQRVADWLSARVLATIYEVQQGAAANP